MLGRVELGFSGEIIHWVQARIGQTRFRTSLFPRAERYLVPIKVAVRNAERLALGDHVTVQLHLDI